MEGRMPRQLNLRRLALVVATAGALVAALPAGAATKTFVITDQAGDANGTNGQELGLPVPSESTSPASVAGADITKITLATDFAGKGKARKAMGFHVLLSLAGPLQKGTIVTVTMDTSMPCGPSSTIQLGYGTSSLAVCQTGGTTNDDIGSYEISADQKTIRWDIAPILKPGTTISNFYASTSVFVFGVFDEATSDKVFTYGK
jgi:hypothetical protein